MNVVCIHIAGREYPAVPRGEKTVVWAMEAGGLPEQYLDALETRWQKNKAELLLFSGDDFSADLAVRLSYRLGGVCALQVESVELAEDRIQVVRRAYGANLKVALALRKTPVLLTMRAKNGEKFPEDAAVEPLAFDAAPPPWLAFLERVPKAAAPRLEDAALIVAGGRGLGSRAGFQQAETLAEALGGMAGASRPAALNAWAGLDRLIGQSGKTVSPEVLLAVGISGSGPFLAGVAAQKLIAVNNDPEAPIFKHADIGVVADGPAFMETLLHLLHTT